MGGFKYKAFISYKHLENGKTAEAVVKSIKRYGRSRFDPRGYRIFRDETSLPKGVPLDTISKELEKSEYLIYLASPAGAQSQWVEKELIQWCKLGRISQLIVVITSGQLIARKSDLLAIDWHQTNVFPKALKSYLTQIPNYADLRWIEKDQIPENELSNKNPRFEKQIRGIVAQLKGGVSPDTVRDDALRVVRRDRRLRNGLISLLVATSLIALTLAWVTQKSLTETRISQEKEKKSRLLAEREKGRAEENAELFLHQRDSTQVVLEDLQFANLIRSEFAEQLVFLSFADGDLESPMGAGNYFFYFLESIGLDEEYLDYIQQASSVAYLKNSWELSPQKRKYCLLFNYIKKRNLSERFVEWAARNEIIPLLDNDIEFLISSSESMSEHEPNYWRNLLEIMSIEQKAKLIDILGKEQASLFAIDVKYRNVTDQQNPQRVVADSLLDNREFEKAEKLYRAILNDDVTQFDVRWPLFRCLKVQGKREQAHRLARQIAINDKYNIDSHYFKIFAEYELDLWTECISTMEIVTHNFPESEITSSMWNLVGNAWYKSGYYDSTPNAFSNARDCYLQILDSDLESDSISYPRPIKDSITASILELSGALQNLSLVNLWLEDQEASKYYQKAALDIAKLRVKRDPEDAGARGSLSWYYLFSGEFQKSLEASESALQMDPEEYWIATNKVHAHIFLGQLEKAKETYYQYISLYQDYDNASFGEALLKDFEEFRKFKIYSKFFDNMELFIKLQESSLYTSK